MIASAGPATCLGLCSGIATFWWWFFGVCVEREVCAGKKCSCAVAGAVARHRRIPCASQQPAYRAVLVEARAIVLYDVVPLRAQLRVLFGRERCVCAAMVNKKNVLPSRRNTTSTHLLELHPLRRVYKVSIVEACSRTRQAREQQRRQQTRRHCYRSTPPLLGARRHNETHHKSLPQIGYVGLGLGKRARNGMACVAACMVLKAAAAATSKLWRR